MLTKAAYICSNIVNTVKTFSENYTHSNVIPPTPIQFVNVSK